jgi:hypothetical protein
MKENENCMQLAWPAKLWTGPAECCWVLVALAHILAEADQRSQGIASVQ